MTFPTYIIICWCSTIYKIIIRLACTLTFSYSRWYFFIIFITSIISITLGTITCCWASTSETWSITTFTVKLSCLIFWIIIIGWTWATAHSFRSTQKKEILVISIIFVTLGTIACWWPSTSEAWAITILTIILSYLIFWIIIIGWT